MFDARGIDGTGTLLLQDIMGLVRQAPRLQSEVDAALRQINKTAAEVTCVGKRIDGRWRYLAGARIQPYACRFGERWLEINAELRVLGRRGESYEKVSEPAMKGARVVRETNPRWNWTTEKPRDWFLD
jgi:hypothetical protein